MIEIHSVFGVCIPGDMGLADIEHASIPENIQAVPVSEEETDTPGINLNQSSPAGNAENSPSTDKP